MAQVKPDYSKVEDFNQIAKVLIDKYPEAFGGIDADVINCVSITNKQTPDATKKRIWEVKTVPYPMRMDCPYGYYLIIYQDDWLARDAKRKALLVAEMLHAIPKTTEEEGTTVAMDYKNYSTLVNSFVTKYGIDYDTNPATPNILTDNNFRFQAR